MKIYEKKNKQNDVTMITINEYTESEISSVCFQHFDKDALFYIETFTWKIPRRQRRKSFLRDRRIEGISLSYHTSNDNNNLHTCREKGP